MAEVAVVDGALRVRLSPVEKVEAVHGDIQVDQADVVEVAVVDEPFKAVHGFRAPGTGVPGVVAVGTWRDGGRRVFVVLHHGQKAVRILLKDASFDELLIGAEDAGGLAAELREALGQ
jgi:hypothetical protein